MMLNAAPRKHLDRDACGKAASYGLCHPGAYSSTQPALRRRLAGRPSSDRDYDAGPERRQGGSRAHLLAWLGSEENTHLCGQVVFVDGGSDAVIRGDSIW